MTQTSRQYPRTLENDSVKVELLPLTADHRETMLTFARSLPRHDLLFLRRDLTRESELDGLLADIGRGLVTTLLALEGGKMVGYATLHRSALHWERHIAELRIVVSPENRKRGLGRLLTQEIFALALDRGVEKMMARMTTDQTGAIRTFEGLGFSPEALLKDHVKDIDGERHDLIVMAHNVAEFD
ncbi:MAG: GNAT family N-acetyltransferase, partial [Acidobacteriota bacterium]